LVRVVRESTEGASSCGSWLNSSFIIPIFF